jgi:hypothetical protein
MNIGCATATSSSVDDPAEASEEIVQAIHRKLTLGASSVGILFCSSDFNLTELASALQSRLAFPLLGCTTYSEATEDGYTTASASLMVLTSDALAIGIGLGEGLRADVAGAVGNAYDEARAALGSEPKLIITFPDAGLACLGEDVILEIEKKNAGRAPVFGGCPADGGKYQQTFQICGGKVYSDSIPILMLGGDINPIIVTRSGWIPLGARARATKVSGNRLLEVDGQPAIEYLQRYIGATDDPDVLGTYPIAMLDERLGEDAGRFFVMRSPFSYDKESGSIELGGQILPGAVIQLARGTRDDILGGVSAAVSKLAERAGGRELACVLFVSCGARKLMLGMAAEREVSLIRGALPGGLPIAGFYSYGEIGAIDSMDERLRDTRYHNTTLVLCAI